MVITSDRSATSASRRAWTALGAVMDPEIPVLSVVDLGIVNSVQADDHSVDVSITPTYVACVASEIMQSDIIAALQDAEFKNVSVKVVRSPAWSSDRMTALGRARLDAYGIAPPALKGQENQSPTCPVCGSTHSRLVSEFSSSACRALYRCESCGEPFDRFKCK